MYQCPFQEISGRNEKSYAPSFPRRPLSPPTQPSRGNGLFKSKPENNYPLNNDSKQTTTKETPRISQSTSGLNCLNGLDHGKAKTAAVFRSEPKLLTASTSGEGSINVAAITPLNSNSGQQRHQQPQQQQPRRRRVGGLSSAPTSPAKNKVVYPVYLRPEQNIPEVFAAASTGFKPIISEAQVMQQQQQQQKGRSVENGGGSKNGVEGVKSGNKGGIGGDGITRDDIVVTVRSAHV